MSLGDVAKARCDTSQRKPPSFIGETATNWIPRSITRESGMYVRVGSRKLAQGPGGAIYDWRRTCDRAGCKFISARTAPSDKTYYRCRADRVRGSCPCFRCASLLPAHSRPCFLFFFFSSMFRLRSRPKRGSKVAIDSRVGRVSSTNFTSTSIDSRISVKYLDNEREKGREGFSLRSREETWNRIEDKKPRMREISKLKILTVFG